MHSGLPWQPRLAGYLATSETLIRGCQHCYAALRRSVFSKSFRASTSHLQLRYTCIIRELRRMPPLLDLPDPILDDTYSYFDLRKDVLYHLALQCRRLNNVVKRHMVRHVHFLFAEHLLLLFTRTLNECPTLCGAIRIVVLKWGSTE